MGVTMPYDDICKGLHTVLAHSRYSVNTVAITLITLSFTWHVECPREEIGNWDPVRSQTQTKALSQQPQSNEDIKSFGLWTG